MAWVAGTTTVVVHDAFVQDGGGERVAVQLAVALGNAPVFTAAVRERTFPDGLPRDLLRPSIVDPLVRRGLPLPILAPLLPAVFGTMRLGAAEVVVSSSSAFAHHVRVPAGAVHVCYCHTPPRFLWELDEYFRGQEARRRLLAPGLAAMRRLDLAAARRVDLYLANSRHVASRIRRVYGREARVVYPPVETALFRPSAERSGRFLVVSRLRNHKRVDLAIGAANHLGVPLDVVGSGPELEGLRRLAGPTVRLLGALLDEDVRHAMARCAGLLVPAEQDFGLVLAEAQASGRPPIALAAGGASEIVDDGRTGFLFREPTVGALAEAMARAARTPLDADELVRSAARFDVGMFRDAIHDAVGVALERRAAEAGGAPAATARPALAPALERREVNGVD